MIVLKHPMPTCPIAKGVMVQVDKIMILEGINLEDMAEVEDEAVVAVI